MLPPLVFIAKSLLPGEDLKGLNVAVLVIQLICPLPAVPESYHISIYSVISQPLQSLVKGAVHHVGLGQKGQVFFIIGRRGASSFNR
jgi:hypothetical protein